MTCEIAGRIDREILGESVRTLARFLPVLTARFVPTDNGCLIRIDDGAPPLEIHRSEDFEAELNFAPNWLAGPLLRVALIEGRTRTTVALNLPRAVADGMSFIALHERLWRIYTELLAGNVVKTYPIAPVLPPSLES